MAEYDPAEPGDAYAPVVNADGTVQVDGELFDAPGAVSTFHISRDRGYDLVAGCPVFMYPHGRDVRVCRLYSNGNGLLPGSVRLPIECIPSWEWQRRVCVPSLHLRATRNQDGDDWISIRLEFLRRIVDRTRRFSHLAQVNCGELNGDVATLFGFATWYCRTMGERAYCQRLYALLESSPAFGAGFGITPALLCLGQRAPSGFRFLPHGRGGAGRGRESRGGAHTQYNNYVRQALRWMERYRVLLDYHNTEVDCVSSAGLRDMYAPLTDEWDKNLLCAWNGFYASMPPSLTYLAHRLTDGEPYANAAWRVLVTERVALIAVEWLRQVYAHMKLWRLSAWTFTCIAELADTLSGCFGSVRNVQDLQALLDRAAMVCPTWFEWDGIPPRNDAEASDYFQRTSRWVPFDPWTDEVLGSEGARVTRLQSRPVYGDERGSWSTRGAEICYLNVRAGDRLPWSAAPAAVPQSSSPSLVRDPVVSDGVLTSSPRLAQPVPGVAAVVDTRGGSAELVPLRIAPSHLSSPIAQIAASPTPSAIAAVVGGSYLDPAMAEEISPARETADVVEVRGTTRVMERPPTPAPSVPVLAAPIVSSPANLVPAASTPRIPAPRSGREEADRPSGRKRRSSRSLSRSARRSRRHADETYSDSDGSERSRRRSRRRGGRSSRRRRRRPPSDSDFTDSESSGGGARRGRRGLRSRRRRVESQSPTVPAVAAQAPVVAAVPSAVMPSPVSSGLRFALGDLHACAIIIRRDGVVDVMAVDGGQVVGWPFAEPALVPPLLVVGVGVPNAITGERVVTTSQNVAHFDPNRPLGG